ncbi:MAG: dienelactone hydrolase [Planctomycetota bacterium]|jgi:dienelactone hydrolase
MLIIFTLAAFWAPVCSTPTEASLASIASEATITTEANMSAPAARRSSKGEDVRIETRDHVRLGGTFYGPKSTKGKAPAALLVHDAGGDRSEVEDLAVQLQKRGFAVLAIDLRGHGDSVSEDTDWEKASDDKARASLWSFAANDLKAASSWLRDRSEIHASNLSIVGVGAGCALAVRHALDDENTRAVVLVAPQPDNFGFNLPQGVGDLEGLPTLILAGKDKRSDATRLMDAAHRQYGENFIEVAVMKSEQRKVLEDKRLATELGQWLKSEVITKR